MTKGKTTLIQKDTLKGTSSNNYRPIMCLPVIWKILTAQIKEEIYYSLISCGLFPEEGKGMLRGDQRHGRTTVYRSIQPQQELNKTENLVMAWIGLKKDYDMVHQSWNAHRLKMYKNT